MALLTKDKINQFGVQEEYWRILSINLNIQYNYCDITLGAYANEDARNSDAEPMNIKKVRAKWDNEEFFKFFAPQTFELKTAKADESSNVSDNIDKRAYDYIKVRDEYFKEAKDC